MWNSKLEQRTSQDFDKTLLRGFHRGFADNSTRMKTEAMLRTHKNNFNGFRLVFHGRTRASFLKKKLSLSHHCVLKVELKVLDVSKIRSFLTGLSLLPKVLNILFSLNCIAVRTFVRVLFLNFVCVLKFCSKIQKTNLNYSVIINKII